MSSWVTVQPMRDVIGKRNGPRTHLVGRTHMVPTAELMPDQNYTGDKVEFGCDKPRQGLFLK